MNSPNHNFSLGTKRRSLTLFLSVLVVAFTAPPSSSSQISVKVASISPSSASPRAPLTVHVSLQQGETIEKVFLLYRSFGTSSYERLDMDIVGNTASATIPQESVLPPFVECYVVLQNRTGGFESYPLNEGRNPFEPSPGKTIQIPVNAEPETDAQVVFLSPEPGARITAGDLLFSISLLRADSIVVKRATQLLLDGADITDHAVISDDIIVVSPENSGIIVRPGTHRLSVRIFNRQGNLHRSASTTFTIIGGGSRTTSAEDLWKYNGSVQLESRHEDIGSVPKWYNRGSILLNGSNGDWRFNANAFITSDEEADRQPQNRYFAGAELPWIRIGYGDAYPSFPSLILSGKRVRGLTSALRLDWFNVDLTLGKTTRGVEGALLQVINADSLGFAQQQDPTAAYGKINDTLLGKFSYGAYARDLFAIRPSFGSGEDWQWGFTWLKSKDDVGSIRYGIRPQENLVVGSDFVARFDDNGIELSAQGAFSAFNSDISSGTFTDANIDSIFSEESRRKEARDVRNVLSRFITVNENLLPLSFKKFPTVAYDAALALNYFDNVFKFTYLFRGSQYNSFGQTFLRKDIKGVNITDRIRLANNRVLTTASVEFLKDNTADLKIATTSFTNLNFAVSYFPDPEYPNVTAGYGRYASNNSLALAGNDSLSAIDDATDRFFLQSTYDFDLSARHTASLNLSTSNREDRSFRHYDVQNTSIGFGLSTKYSIPLQTDVNVSINMNTLPTTTPGTSQGFNYTIVSLNARYAIIRDILSITAATSPTFGDFTRTAWDASIAWTAMPTMIVELQLSLYKNPGMSNDTIWSLRYRYDV